MFFIKYYDFSWVYTWQIFMKNHEILPENTQKSLNFIKICSNMPKNRWFSSFLALNCMKFWRIIWNLNLKKHQKITKKWCFLLIFKIIFIIIFIIYVAYYFLFNHEFWRIIWKTSKSIDFSSFFIFIFHEIHWFSFKLQGLGQGCETACSPLALHLAAALGFDSLPVSACGPASSLRSFQLHALHGCSFDSWLASA